MIEVIYALVAVGYFLGLDKEDDGEERIINAVVALFWPVSIGVRISRLRGDGK